MAETGVTGGLVLPTRDAVCFCLPGGRFGSFVRYYAAVAHNSRLRTRNRFTSAQVTNRRFAFLSSPPALCTVSRQLNRSSEMSCVFRRLKSATVFFRCAHRLPQCLHLGPHRRGFPRLSAARQHSAKSRYSFIGLGPLHKEANRRNDDRKYDHDLNYARQSHILHLGRGLYARIELLIP
jgi:hypothetical protein